MKLKRRVVAVIVLAAGVACSHAPSQERPAYDFRKSAVGLEPGRKAEGAFPSADSANQVAYRVAIPATGSLVASATAANPAARLGIEIYTGGSAPLAKGAAAKPVETRQLPPGTYWIVVTNAEKAETGFTLLALFKPDDPDLRGGPYRARSGARELPPDDGHVSDRVDYSGMTRTNYWRIDTPAQGDLKVTFDPEGANLVAEIEGPEGAPARIDPATGYEKNDLPAGDYYVKVYAVGPGDAGPYRLSTTFTVDPCRNGGAACAREGAEELKLPQDSKVGEVDFKRAMQRHYYKASLQEKGRLTVAFKVLEPRGSKVAALFLRPSEAPERIIGTGTKEIDNPGDYYIEVIAPATGDYAKYSLQTTWQPANFVSGDVVELGRNPCLLTVQAGTRQGVRAGAPCTIVVGSNPAAIDSCVVDQAFPNLCKVRPLGAGCHIPSQNVRVQISQ
ncbi:MAG: hypothetical protein ACJ78X_16980 [Myxococcales bacterium]